MSDESPSRPAVPGHQLTHVLGEGASGAVWAGTDAVGRPVAVKVPHRQPDDVARRQTETERHVLMAVRHEHLVALRDVVTLDDGRVALVFDLVRGCSVRALVRARSHLRPGETVTVLTPVCEAVATLHAAGATHCDITPGNVLLTEDGRPLLGDLGAARVAGAGSGAVVGTEGFVAPEVLAGEPPTEASDVYALGALAWHCLTGYGAPQTPIRLDAETVRSHVGPQLAEVVAACIDPDPAQRPRSEELAGRFFAAAAAEPLEVVLAPDEASALTQRLRREAAAGASPAVSPPCLPSRRRLGLAAAAVLVLTTVAVLWWSLAGPGSSLAGPERGDAGAGASAASVGARPGPALVPRPAATNAGARPAGAPSASARRPPARDVTTDPQAPRGDPVALLQALVDRRARALTERDPDALPAVHSQGSATLRADQQLLRALSDNAQTYAGLRLSVATARPVSVGADRAVLRARVDVAAYEVVTAGQRVQRSGGRGMELDFTVRRLPQGWRLASVTDP